MPAPMSPAQLKDGEMATTPGERANRSLGVVKGKPVASAARALEPAINSTPAAAAAAPAALPGGSGGLAGGSDINRRRRREEKRGDEPAPPRGPHWCPAGKWGVAPLVAPGSPPWRRMADRVANGAADVIPAMPPQTQPRAVGTPC